MREWGRARAATSAYAFTFTAGTVEGVRTAERKMGTFQFAAKVFIIPWQISSKRLPISVPETIDARAVAPNKQRTVSSCATPSFYDRRA